MAEETAHEGGCLCGEVRYRIEGAPVWVCLCHCTMCRRASGAPAVAWLTLPMDRFAFTKGEAHSYVSSDHGRRGFCPDCGSQLTFWSSRTPGDIDVTLGSLDRPEAFPLSHHTFVTGRLDWLRLKEALPEYPGCTPEGQHG